MNEYVVIDARTDVPVGIVVADDWDTAILIGRGYTDYSLVYPVEVCSDTAIDAARVAQDYFDYLDSIGECR